ncbi:MAG: peptide deformylase [Negativicutes bacterium]|nr:peptide deformylase [Negativicutes bacterium]
MAIRDILLLGDESLYNVSREITRDELGKARQVVADLHDTMVNFREKYGFGRAIAAPQIGEFLRIIYLNFGGQSYALLNPAPEFGTETFQVWDDCMSFPGLEVKLTRYRKTKLSYTDLAWKTCILELENDLSELIQHEYDHLDGVLAVDRARDNRSLRINKAKSGCF